MLRVLDLFSGIGGFSLGLERAGMRTVAFCEIEPYPRAVLKKHWPDVPIYDDVRTLTGARLAADGIAVDVICGGFPCQDISVAGKGAGLAGERSGLWFEYARIIGEVRPRYVIVENVARLLVDGMGVVLGDLARLGFDAQWHRLRASAFGFPHARRRVWIVANRHDERELQPRWGFSDEWRWHRDRGPAVDWVLARGGVLRSADGLSAELDRIGATGNAVVPQIPEMIGRAIISDQARRAA